MLCAENGPHNGGPFPVLWVLPAMRSRAPLGRPFLAGDALGPVALCEGAPGLCPTLGLPALCSASH